MAVRFAMPVLSLASVSVLTFCPNAAAQEAKDAAADRLKVVRATYEKLPPTILQVKEPIRVTQCSHQTVPAVTNLMFTDADQINYSSSWWLDKGKFQNREFDHMYWTRYKGLSSVGEKQYMLPVRGPEEDALYGLLLRWVAAKEKDKDATLFDKSMLKEVSTLLEKFDDRFAGEKPVLQK